MGFFSSSKSKQEKEQLAETKNLLKRVNPNIRDGMTYLDLPVKKLPQILLPSETVEFAVRNTGDLAVCTNQRLIIIRAENTLHADVEDISYDKINSIKIDSGMGLDSLVIATSGNKIKVTHLEKTESKALHDYLRTKINQAISPAVSTSQSLGNEDTISKLERLAKLKEQGILTEQEFAEQKAAILNK